MPTLMLHGNVRTPQNGVQMKDKWAECKVQFSFLGLSLAQADLFASWHDKAGYRRRQGGTKCDTGPVAQLMTLSCADCENQLDFRGDLHLYSNRVNYSPNTKLMQWLEFSMR